MTLLPVQLKPFPVRSALLILLVCMAGGGLLRADPPTPPPGPELFVLLRNGNVLQGKPVQEGDRVTIFFGPQQSLRLPVGQVLCWAETREALYRYRVDHRQTSDLLTHLDAARWCLQQQLFAAAEQELLAARALDAQHVTIKQLEVALQTARRRALEGTTDSDTKPSDQHRHSVRTASHSEPAAASPANAVAQAGHAGASSGFGHTEDAALPPDHDALETTLAKLPKSVVADYASRVQPILINRCGQSGCHGGGDGSKAAWQMALPLSRRNPRLPAGITRSNLHDLMRWIDAQEHERSPLLKKASEAHGGASDSPLGLADGEVLAELEQWIAAVAAPNQQAATARPTSPARKFAAATASNASVAHSDLDTDAVPQETSPNAPATSLQPKRLPPVHNPFDPQVFNRLHHRD